MVKKSPDPSKLVIILDNHRAHHSNMLEEAVKSQGVSFLFLPPYSCQLNSIERLWSIIKRKWRKEIVRSKGNISADAAKE
jgi:transposase